MWCRLAHSRKVYRVWRPHTPLHHTIPRQNRAETVHADPPSLSHPNRCVLSLLRAGADIYARSGTSVLRHESAVLWLVFLPAYVHCPVLLAVAPLYPTYTIRPTHKLCYIRAFTGRGAEPLTESSNVCHSYVRVTWSVSLVLSAVSTSRRLGLHRARPLRQASSDVLGAWPALPEPQLHGLSRILDEGARRLPASRAGGRPVPGRRRHPPWI